MGKGHLRPQEIVANILDMAETSGLSRVTTAALARRIGFTEAALYRYFPGKEAILAAALSHVAEELFTTMSSQMSPDDCAKPVPAAELLGQHIRSFTVRRGLLVELLLSAAVNGTQELHEAADAFLQEYMNRMRVYFEQLQSAGCANPTAVAEELATMWTCQLLGGFVRCRLTHEPWQPDTQDAFKAFLARMATNPHTS